MKNSTNNSGLSKIVAGLKKSPVEIRNLLDGTSASKAFDYVFLHGKQEEFESSKNQLQKINNKFLEELVELSKEEQEQYQEKKANYLSKLPSNLTSEESKIACQVYDELYQAQLKEMLREECEEYEKKAKKFGETVGQNLEKANKEADPAYPDVIGSAVLMMTPFGLFAVFDYFDQLQQVYEVLQPAIDGLQTSLENVPFVGDLMKEFYGLSGSEVGSSATAFAGSLSNDFLLKSAISYFATGRMAGKLIDSYDDKKQNFDSAIEKVEKFNSALTNEFNKRKSEITDRALKNCGLDDENNSKVIKEAVESRREEIKSRKKDVSSFNKSFFNAGADDKQKMIKSLLEFNPATANNKEKEAFIEKAWIVFFAAKDSDIESSRGKEKRAPKAIEEKSGDNYFNQLSIPEELAFANKFSQINISLFKKDEELKSSIKDLCLIQGKAMIVGGLQNDSAEFLKNLLPNQTIEKLGSENFQANTLKNGKIYETRLQKLNPQDLDKMSALILHEKIKDGGHYTALIKQKIVENGQEELVWLHYNDGKVEIKSDAQMQSILKDKTVRNVVNSSELPIATKDPSEKIKPAFSGLKNTSKSSNLNNTGNSCFANSAVALINSLPKNNVVKKEFVENLDKVGVGFDLQNNSSMIVASEGKSNKLNISQLQNKFIAKESAVNVAKKIVENQEQQSQILTGKQPTEQKTR